MVSPVVAPPRDKIKRILESLGLEAGNRFELRDLAGGTYNTVVAGRLEDGSDVVIKISPPAHQPQLSYEADLLATEAEYFRLARVHGVPVPEVRGHSRDVVPGQEVLVLSRLAGVNFAEIRDTVEPVVRSDVRRELGAAVGLVHRVTSGGFGYPLREGRFWRATWREAFGAMLSGLLEDAERYSVELPVPTTELEKLIDRSGGCLDEITTPVLVHFDLWDGNLLVDRRRGTAQLSGMIDAERAMYADPAFELPSLFLDREFDPDDDFLSGYAETSDLLVPGDVLALRVALYSIYLYLVMLIEAVPRGYSAAAAARNRDRCSQGILRHLAVAHQAG